MIRPCFKPPRTFSGGRTSLILRAFVVLAGLLLTPASASLARAADESAGTGKPFVWQTAAPESQGLSREKLDALKDSLAAKNTKAFLVIRNDQIVYEWYAADHGPAKTHSTASLAKALVGGLALGVALSDGRIALDDKVAKYIPQWKDDPRKSKIEIRHLGSHTSGLADAEQDRLPHEKLTGWKGVFWKRLQPPDDPFTLARDQTPMLFEPGAKLQYSNPGIALLSYAVTASLKDGPQKDLRTLLRERVMRPIGVLDTEWSIGYGTTYKVDGLPLVAPWGGGSYTARAVARIGRLLLRDGDWDGTRLLSKEAVRQILASAGLPGDCGMGWWTNAAQRYPKLPKDAVWGAGAGDQVLLVIPSLNLIMVRNGASLVPPLVPAGDTRPIDALVEFHDPRTKVLFEPLIEAFTGDVPAKTGAAPYPPSRAIKRIDWAPPETILRKAKGSDNWPLTWADDDHLYTAYGDGWGFDPRVPEKLSLGIARIEHGPADFTGINVRSPSIEQKGDGKAGKKASGLLMVDGVLYLWVRNAGNAQLAWSNDHGKAWMWSDWKFTTSFGCPTFLNFGKNYAGARDDYVYVYSHDQDSAYLPADRMVLARVPKGRIKDRAAYEFFKTLGAENRPVWSADLNERGAAFTHPGNCYRSGISYNAGLKRYLWCQILPGKDPRFAGGFGVYDAPEPWGPWTTAYFTENWDVGPGETSSFPTKWMSADGKTLYLVFSGGDNFSVRRAALDVAGK
jgi:CubicO group peptidase (beta-lactamase class C family)